MAGRSMLGTTCGMSQWSAATRSSSRSAPRLPAIRCGSHLIGLPYLSLFELVIRCAIIGFGYDSGIAFEPRWLVGVGLLEFASFLRRLLKLGSYYRLLG